MGLSWAPFHYLQAERAIAPIGPTAEMGPVTVTALADRRPSCSKSDQDDRGDVELEPTDPDADLAGCGAMGCAGPAEWVVYHPEKGRRVVCTDHAIDLLPVSPDPPSRPAGELVRRCASIRGQRTRATEGSESGPPGSAPGGARGSGTLAGRPGDAS